MPKTAMTSSDIAETQTLLAGTPRRIDAATAVLGNHTHSVYSQARRLALHEATHCAEIKALAAQLRGLK